MSPEKAAIHSLDSRKRIDDINEAAELLLPLHEKIAPLMEQMAIHPENFESLYGSEAIAQDTQYVTKMQRMFDEEADNSNFGNLTEGEVRKLAEVLEFQVIKGINVGNWLPFCTAIKTSEYDDIKNGIDLVLTYEKGLQMGNMGMGIDVSFSHNLRKKFQRIKDEIDNYDGSEQNRLGYVKYFHDRKTGSRGELSSLPRVVVALDTGVMKDLAFAKDGGKGHIARHSVLSEMELQLAVFSDYAREENPQCLDSIMRAQNFIHTLITHFHSDEVLSESGYFKNRKIQDAIQEGLSIFR